MQGYLARSSVTALNKNVRSLRKENLLGYHHLVHHWAHVARRRDLLHLQLGNVERKHEASELASLVTLDVPRVLECLVLPCLNE